MKIYVNPVSFECHTTNPDGTYLEYETPFFDGKCQTFIEGYRCILPNCRWKRSDGIIFHGEMIAPWKDYSELDSAQREYEREKLADAENALAILLGGAV